MAKTVKISFPNNTGHELFGYVQLPADRHPSHFALLAHCFSCTKNAGALREIARALNMAGYGVLRFDMTGLGESEGDFAETGFASNVADLVAAYAYLKEAYRPPALVVGHSLGGTAALCASKLLPEVRAVVTIGSPSDPNHVTHLFGDGERQREEVLTEIRERGRATVQLQGRPFDIGLGFVESLTGQDVEDSLETLDKPLLILHSPQDRTVAIEHAERIYVGARHPKSFITLDGADHMLSDKADARYAGRVIAAWVSRYLPRTDDSERLGRAKAVAVRLGAEGFTTEIMARHHALIADEPERVGGDDFGPGPYELVAAGLGACTAMTIQMYARRKGWRIERVDVQVRHFKDYARDMTESASDEAGTASAKTRIDHFERVIELESELTEAQVAKVLQIADKCPVHRTLHGEVRVITRLGEIEA